MSNDNQGEQKTMANQNTWTLVKFKDISKFLESNEVSQIKFAQTLGVSNSTFHNWKGGRSTPDEEMQQKILDVIAKESLPGGPYVNIVVSDGVVHLWGLADSDEVRKALRIAAESVPGARRVEDHLSLRTKYFGGV